MEESIALSFIFDESLERETCNQNCSFNDKTILQIEYQWHYNKPPWRTKTQSKIYFSLRAGEITAEQDGASAISAAFISPMTSSSTNRSAIRRIFL